MNTLLGCLAVQQTGTLNVNPLTEQEIAALRELVSVMVGEDAPTTYRPIMITGLKPRTNHQPREAEEFGNKSLRPIQDSPIKE